MVGEALAADFEIHPKGPYSLASSIVFLEGFAPAGREGSNQTDHLDMAFMVAGSEEAVGVRVWSEDGKVVGKVYGDADPGVVRAQVARILSLDVDGSDFPEVGERDPVIGRLQQRYPGLRPVCFYSPYEAAAWALISHRIRITQASRTKSRMAEALGTAVEIDGAMHHAFPSPSRLQSLEGFPGLFGRKAEYLRELGKRAEEGALDAARLRAMPSDEAIAALKKLPGIGDFSAQLILLRGAGEPDFLPTDEPRLGRAVARAYALEEPPSPETLAEMTGKWRPYRTWATFLLRVMLEEETQEIASGGRHKAP